MSALQQVGSSRIRHDWHQFAAGGGAAIVNIMYTFPAHKLILRQQIDGIGGFQAFKQLRREGFLKLFRGVGPPLLMKGVGLSVMFGSFSSFERILTEQYPKKDPALIKVSAALLAGTVESLLTPFERMQTLLALSEHKDFVRVHNSIHVFLKIYKHYNFKEYYRGFSAILLRNGPSTALFFSLRQPIKDALPDTNYKFQDILEDFISGAVLGASISTFFYPLNVVKSNMQKRLGAEYKSVYRTFLDVYDLRGRSFRKMYFGVSINFTRALASWGIINASYELLKEFLQEYC